LILLTPLLRYCFSELFLNPGHISLLVFMDAGTSLWDAALLPELVLSKNLLLAGFRYWYRQYSGEVNRSLMWCARSDGSAMVLWMV